MRRVGHLWVLAVLIAVAIPAHAGKKAQAKQEANFFGHDKLYTIHLT